MTAPTLWRRLTCPVDVRAAKWFLFTTRPHVETAWNRPVDEESLEAALSALAGRAFRVGMNADEVTLVLLYWTDCKGLKVKGGLEGLVREAVSSASELTSQIRADHALIKEHSNVNGKPRLKMEKVLTFLASLSDGLTHYDIAQQFDVSPSSARKFMQRMVKHGFAFKAARDRYKSLTQSQSAGVVVLMECPTSYQDNEEAISLIGAGTDLEAEFEFARDVIHRAVRQSRPHTEKRDWRNRVPFLSAPLTSRERRAISDEWRHHQNLIELEQHLSEIGPAEYASSLTDIRSWAKHLGLNLYQAVQREMQLKPIVDRIVANDPDADYLGLARSAAEQEYERSLKAKKSKSPS